MSVCEPMTPQEYAEALDDLLADFKTESQRSHQAACEIHDRARALGVRPMSPSGHLCQVDIETALNKAKSAAWERRPKS